MASAVLLSLVPAAFWLWYLSQLGPFKGRLALVSAFGLGLLSPLFVFGLEALGLSFPMPPTAFGRLVFFVFQVGLVEEAGKLLVAGLIVWAFGRREPLQSLFLAGGGRPWFRDHRKRPLCPTFWGGGSSWTVALDHFWTCSDVGFLGLRSGFRVAQVASSFGPFRSSSWFL